MDPNRIIDYYLGKLSPEEEAAVQQWIAAHAEDPAVSCTLESLYAGASDAADEPALSSVYDRLAGRLHMERPRRPRWWLPVSVAALLAALLCLPLAFRAGIRSAEESRTVAQWVEKSVPAGASERLELPDGSVLQLKAGTRIVYPSVFDGPERKVFIDGEIYADIAKDPDRPFLVSAGDATVRVLGTRFNLKSSTDFHSIETLLLEGSVQLDLKARTGQRRMTLEPGNLVRFDRETGVVEITDVDPDLFGNDPEGRSFYYYHVDMQDIATDLGRKFGEKIVVLDEALARSRFFAIFSNDESLDEILAAMNADRRMRITRRDGVVYLQSSKPIK